MKRKLLAYGSIVGLCIAFIIQGCSKDGDLKKLVEETSEQQTENQNLPTIQVTSPSAGGLVEINRIAKNITVAGTVTTDETGFTFLSYTLDGETEVDVPSFDGSSFSFLVDLLGHSPENRIEGVSLKLILRNAAGTKVVKTIPFRLLETVYENPVVVITSPMESQKYLIAGNVPTELAAEIAGKTVTITGTVQSQGESTYTYDIGDGPQPLTVIDKIFSQEISFPNLADMETKENITLTITATDQENQEGSSSITFSVSRWDLGSTQNLPFTYAGTAVTYKTVRANDGNIWLQQNLGSSQVATSTTDAASYGDYFQWGRWADGHQKSNSTTISATTITPNDPSYFKNKTGSQPYVAGAGSPAVNWWSVGGATTNKWEAADPAAVSATNGCDPCKEAMGTGWRLPTKVEWEKVIAKEKIIASDGANTAYNSNLKLPQSGYRHFNAGATVYVGTLNYTWTSTASNATNGWMVNIRPAVAALSSSPVRGHGGTIRCINVQ